MYLFSNNTDNYIYAQIPTLTNTWTHIIYTYNGKALNTGIKVYQNGTLSGSITKGNVGTYVKMVNGSAGLSFGRLANSGINTYSGNLDGFSIRNKKLTSTKAIDIYNTKFRTRTNIKHEKTINNTHITHYNNVLRPR